MHNCLYLLFLSVCITVLCSQVTYLCLYLKDVSFREPKVQDSLSWRKQKSQTEYKQNKSKQSVNKTDQNKV